MEKAKFTQGEWRLGTYSSIVGCPIMAQPDKTKNQFNIAAVHGGTTIEEVKANAKLISAAPDLLEALIEVVKISDRKHDAWDKAKAAIKKATT